MGIYMKLNKILLLLPVLAVSSTILGMQREPSKRKRSSSEPQDTSCSNFIEKVGAQQHNFMAESTALRETQAFIQNLRNTNTEQKLICDCSVLSPHASQLFNQKVSEILTASKPEKICNNCFITSQNKTAVSLFASLEKYQCILTTDGFVHSERHPSTTINSQLILDHSNKQNDLLHLKKKNNKTFSLFLFEQAREHEKRAQQTAQEHTEFISLYSGLRSSVKEKQKE